MKRITSLVLVFFLLSSLFPSAVYADTAEEIIPLENGDYIIVTTRAFETYATGTKTGSRDYTYKSGSTTRWKATLTGAFTYNGKTASCTNASCSVEVYDPSWYVVSKSAAKSGGTATADITMGYKVLGGATSKTSYTITLSCDKDGKLS